MALIRWEPARELYSLQRDLNRRFGTVFDSQTRAPGAGFSRRWVPAVDVVEEEQEYVLRADLPGLSEDDVKVEVAERVLTVSGERHSEHEESREGYRRVERASGSFSRSLRLPAGVDAEAIAATFEQGVLEVRIPKPAQPQPQRVEIKVGAVAEAGAVESGEPAAQPADPAA